MSLDCTMRMGGGLIAMQQLKASGELCGVLKELGLVQKCPAEVLTPAQQRALDKMIMCEVYNCCRSPQSNPRVGNEQFSRCVDDVFRSVDSFSGWKSRYKAEVSFRDGQPIMFPPGGTRPWYPTARFPKFPAGSKRPDIVAVSNPALAPLPGNIDAIYEFKFPGDKWGKDQRGAYNKIAGNSKNVVEISDDTCPDDDDDGNKRGVLETASATQLAKDNARAAAVNRATAAAVAATPIGRGLSWLAKGFSETLAAFGTMVGAVP